ncbi:MAG: DUF4062 domain-containing protein, partial [Treponema sp.]|nr:DUF4062 domain-containing protein [Treponema sp.]
MLKKYLIYISSTLDDLRAERKELIKIVTELGAVPITMDNYDIADPESHGIIKKAIQESDYFINLTAYKCGPAIGKTFGTEMEFSWAEKLNVPVLSFIIDEKARWKAAKKEKTKEAAKALDHLKKRLHEHINVSWMNTADLCQKAYIYLIREMNLNPRQGWIRGDDAAMPVTANELARLIRENEQYRSRLGPEANDLAAKLGEQIKHCLKVLAINRISLSFWYASGENWENSKEFRYLRLFKLLAPELIIPKTTSEITRFLGNILNPDLDKTVRKDNPTPTNTIKKIMADFGMLKLVRPIRDPKTPVSGEDEAWELTEYGREVFAVYR